MAEETSGGYDSRAETLAHVHRVRDHIGTFLSVMLARAAAHDASKLVEPEKSAFDLLLPRLRGVPYGSAEFRAVEAEMAEAIARRDPEAAGAARSRSCSARRVRCCRGCRAALAWCWSTSRARG